MYLISRESGDPLINPLILSPSPFLLNIKPFFNRFPNYLLLDPLLLAFNYFLCLKLLCYTHLYYLHIQPYTHTHCMVHVQPCPSPPISLSCICSPPFLLSLTPSLPLSLHQQEEDGEEEEEEGRSKKARMQRRPGDRWMLRGPIEYVPPATVEVLLRRQAIPLDENEGIYVRDIKTGKVRQSEKRFFFFF